MCGKRQKTGKAQSGKESPVCPPPAELRRFAKTGSVHVLTWKTNFFLEFFGFRCGSGDMDQDMDLDLDLNLNSESAFQTLTVCNFSTSETKKLENVENIEVPFPP